MHRTEGTNNLVNMFTNGPPATCVEQNWLNAIQEELAYVIEQASIALETANTDTHTQLYQAIMSMLTGMGTFKFTPYAIAPVAPDPGDLVMADRVNWDPLAIGSGGAYLTMYLGAGSGWGAITGQLD